jgi:hypothetical protein
MLKKRKMLRAFFLLAAGVLMVGVGYAQTTAPLKSYWHDGRIDYFGAATEQGQKAALTAFGYSFVRLEGYVYPSQQPGTIALELYWSEERQDNATIATAESKAEALAARFECKATEGYIYPNEKPGTVPLKLYFNKDLNDYYSTTPQAGEKAAIEAGYKFVRIEGYILPSTNKE